MLETRTQVLFDRIQLRYRHGNSISILRQMPLTGSLRSSRPADSRGRTLSFDTIQFGVDRFLLQELKVVTLRRLAEIMFPDVLISYAEADNRDGGVAQFYTQLNQELQVQLGRPPRIVFRNAPREALPAEELERATLLVAILTPSYLSSPGCRREMEAFLDKEVRNHRLKAMALVTG